MKPRKLLLLLAASVALTVPAFSHAAFDAFLKIDGIEGESQDDKHKNEILVESWSFGASQSASTGGGAGAGRSCLSDITFVKVTDKSTPMLLMATMIGTHLPKATLSVRKAGGKQQDYLIITMEDVLVSSLQQSGGGDLPMESLSLNFAAVKLTYHAQRPDGSLGDPVETRVAGGRC